MNNTDSNNLLSSDNIGLTSDFNKSLSNTVNSSSSDNFFDMFSSTYKFVIGIIIILIILSCLFSIYLVWNGFGSFWDLITKPFKVLEDYFAGTRIPDKKPCPPGQRDDGTSCWLDTYDNGVGTIPPKKPCPESQRDDGTSCWLDTYSNGVGTIPLKKPCDSDQRDDGTSCCWILIQMVLVQFL